MLYVVSTLRGLYSTLSMLYVVYTLNMLLSNDCFLKFSTGSAVKHHHRRYHCDHPNSTETIIINVIIADFTFWKMVSGRTWRRSTAVRASLSVSRAVSVEDGT